MCGSVAELIGEVEIEYEKALSEYEDNGILLERHDDKFRDSDNNIFTYDEHSILMGLIDRYRVIKNQRYNRNYEEAEKQLKTLQREVDEHFKSINRRMRQIGPGEDSEKLSSEMYFINDFQNRLKLSIKLIRIGLIPFENYVKHCDEIGVDLCEDKDYTLFLVNKCLLLNHAAMFNDECIKILDKLTKRVKGRKEYSNDLLFCVGTLAIQYRLYKNAEVIFTQLIAKLEHKIITDCANNDEKYMYFSSYMMLISSYEYSGEYNRALITLIGDANKNKPIDVCRSWLEKISGILKGNNNYKIEDLCFATDDKNKRKEIIHILREIVVKNNPFESNIAKFSYSNGDVFYEITKELNEHRKTRIQELYREKDENRIDVINRVCEKYCETPERNKPLHDFLHLLAHCINEEAVLVIHRQYPSEEEVYKNLVTLARALMLLVSEDEETYQGAHSFKTCFATVYAEAGEFHIASRSISEIVMDAQYSKMDVVSKAEIDFFYYLLPRIDDISNGNPINFSVEGNQHYNHYLNCCYRNFDFDAISHISLLSFEYQVAVMLQNGDLVNIAKEFKKRMHKSGDGLFETKYRQAVNIKNLDAHNIWLKNERNKVKYMFQFLKLYFESDDKGITIRNPRIYEIAYQYLKINNSFGQNPDTVDIPYIDFDDTENAICVIQKLFAETNLEGNLLTIDNIKLILAGSTDALLEKDSMSACFVCDENKQYLKSMEEDDPDYARIRYFNNKSAAIKEFFLMATLMKIKEDFINPSRIFIMTPVNNAEPCKFLVRDNNSFIAESYENEVDSEYDFDDVNSQYSLSLIRPSLLSRDWLIRLNYASTNWVWALTFMVKVDKVRNTKYTVYYRDKQPMSSIIHNRQKCENILNGLYKKSAIRHVKKCNASRLCYVCKVDNINKQELKQLLSSFSEIAWADYVHNYEQGKLLLWKSVNEQRAVWRIVLTKDEKEMESMMTAICNCGQELPFAKRKEDTVQDWPTPYDALIGDKPYIFICHLGKEDNFVKEELNSFFEFHGIRYWYDHEMILGDDWFKKVKEIISRKNCVGCIMLVTKQEFFESHSINREFAEIECKKRENPDFSIVPIIYGCYGEEELNEMVRRAYGQGNYSQQNAYRTCIDLIGIGHTEHLKIYLNEVKGNSLQAFHLNEMKSGRKMGAVLELCNTLHVVKEEI
ncbi:MAG: hypothetical protein HDR11_16595 [Lachnospiraceae bacterium]|nr:hypothetical protein [Lachnospiraceae bacterium]